VSPDHKASIKRRLENAHSIFDIKRINEIICHVMAGNIQEDLTMPGQPNLNYEEWI
jgi:predicted hydrocarbon binding protein